MAAELSKLMGIDIGFVPDCVGQSTEEAVSKLEPGEVLLLEN